MEARNTHTTMEQNTKPMSPAMQREDEEAVTAILAMEGYSSLKPEYSKEAMYHKAADGTESGIRVELEAAEADLILKLNAADAARDLVNILRWKRHDWKLGATEQVVAIYGKNSNEHASTGRKKKIEYKKPGRRGPAAPKAAK